MPFHLFNTFFNRRKNKPIPEVTDLRDDDEKSFMERSQQQLVMLEEIRQEKLASFLFRKKIAIPTAAIITPALAYADYWLMFLHMSKDDEGAAGLSVFFLGALYTWVTSPRRQYAKAYKERILPEIAKLFGNFTYDMDGQIPLHHMQKSKILPRHDKYESEDYFIGQYKGVNIQFSEVDFKQKRRSKNRTYYVSVYKGLAILLDMQTKKFYGHTMLERDKGKVSEWFKERSSKLKRANLVDPEFEKMFDVYTNDQVEARYLIDPVMIEKIKGLQEEYDGESLTAAFYDSKMLVLIQSPHNYFEPAELEVPASDPRSIISMKREIGQVLSLIDRLSLYDPYAVHGDRENNPRDDEMHDVA